MNKLMIIEDSQIIREELKSLLTRYGYNVIACENFENILEDIEKERPELILLDINLPVYDGFHICREVRKTLNIPIIIVTSRDSEIDELMSMNLGADDFITKPYNTQILLARISAVLKRTYTDVSSDVLVYKDLSLDLSKGTITAFGQSVELSKNEIKILAHLMKNKEKIVSRDDLMNYMWNSDVYIDDNTLSVNMTRIRKKLEELDLKDYIETRRGLGYILR
ncbi:MULTISPECIES: response regulator transcription factor [Paraclostridium]|uniref:Stage 0 sporulation protein A homolog n=3 Tax=Paraclostridium bifermentans TaxID=1490 RepID=A0A5P3XAQ0_PARBF|nr:MULTISPECIES: response regulator transcription factor [Paraclostridium]KGJ49631.1 XRE family transcriptional regulator [Clostridium sp. NCR]MCU9809974.1 response regulator transcription factor [Paraclostridium sp. AKS46]MDV8112703.1 response regulator transcription factor [Bacillus sp. BAU-SS-2023]EQK38623.1 transcriptional regulatory family protein [[Clostridium] bifermentans ATCC 19299] [Paraclostridium bifermentans ATCC 19299]MBN8047235.1 response regulator transcription factor [Paraclos